MSTSVQPIAGIAPTTSNPVQAPATPAQSGQQADTQAATTVKVTRAASAPVYVYRVTDTATGRLLLELPNLSVADEPGGKVDATV